MAAPFYHDTFSLPPTRDSVPPTSCLSANRMSADTLLPFLYSGHTLSGHAPSSNAPSDHAPRPSPRMTPEQEEQEGFADGFVRALASLHEQGGVATGVMSANGASCVSSLSRASGASSLSGGGGAGGASSLSGGSVEPLVYTSLAASCHQHRVSMPTAHQHSVSMTTAHQHRVSMTTAHQHSVSMTTAHQAAPDVSERKKLRNRLAASRCRRRKLERIARLEERARALRGLNGRLVAKATRLRGQVGALRSHAATHLTGGCQVTGHYR
ncbi:unnamed protein product [Merluccius merluccius]